MVTLYDATRPVHSGRARRFGAGLLRSLPTYRLNHTFDDERWLAEESARRAAENRHLDQMAHEALAVDRLTAGCLL